MPPSDREIVHFQFGPSLGKIPFEYREAGDSFEIQFIGKEEWHKLADLLVPVEEKSIDFLQHVRVNGAEWLTHCDVISDDSFENRDASILWETESGRRLTSLVRTFLKKPEDNSDSEVAGAWTKQLERDRTLAYYRNSTHRFSLIHQFTDGIEHHLYGDDDSIFKREVEHVKMRDSIFKLERDRDLASFHRHGDDDSIVKQEVEHDENFENLYDEVD